MNHVYRILLITMLVSSPAGTGGEYELTAAVGT